MSLKLHPRQWPKLGLGAGKVSKYGVFSSSYLDTFPVPRPNLGHWQGGKFSRSKPFTWINFNCSCRRRRCCYFCHRFFWLLCLFFLAKAAGELTIVLHMLIINIPRSTVAAPPPICTISMACHISTVYTSRRWTKSARFRAVLEH